jgi:hypothetical protein
MFFELQPERQSPLRPMKRRKELLIFAATADQRGLAAKIRRHP